jgi:hypothetical protein
MKTKKRLKTMMVVMVVGIFGISESLRAAISNSVIEDNIEYYIEVEKSVYDLGEDVEFLYRITNLRDEEWRVITYYPIVDVVVDEKDGEDFNEIWNWSWSQVYPMGPTVFTLGSQESMELNASWPQINLHGSVEIEDHTQVLAGSYRLSGICYISDVSIPVDIDIVPEPGSVTLFIMGISVLMRSKRKK